MKKVVFIFLCSISVTLLSSCTDNTNELITNERSIDKNDVQPGDRG
ncbi:hypothetical protein [Tenacibaculum amylolyticum]